MNQDKKQLIEDIQDLLNSYNNENTTSINPNLLDFMDRDTLIDVISSLLDQKEKFKDLDIEWLEKFKKYDK